MAQPAYLSQYFGKNGIPQEQAQTIGAVPNVDPQSIMAGVQAQGSQGLTGDFTSGLAGVDTSNTDFISKIMGGLQPTFNNQQQGLNEQLASLGIFGGSTVGADQQLGMTQQSTAQGLLQPALLQNIQNQLSQQQGVGQMGLTQAQDLAGITQQDVANNLAAQTQNQNTRLAGSEFNAGQRNNAQQFNISDMLKAASGDTSTYNTFLAQNEANQQADYTNSVDQQNENYRAGLAANAGANNTGQSGADSAYQPIYQQTAPSGATFGNAFGSAAGGNGSSGSSVPQSNSDEYGQTDYGYGNDSAG